MTTTVCEVENKIPDYIKYIITEKFDELNAESFSAILKQANLVSKTDFDNKLISFNTKITSNYTKYLEVNNNSNKNNKWSNKKIRIF